MSSRRSKNPSVQSDKNDPGYKALEKALAAPPKRVIDWMDKAGLVGMGGAGFPTAIKWRSLLEADSDEKHVIMNAEEGEPGTFKDLWILENNPRLVIDGLLIAMRATQATHGHICIRPEYSKLKRKINKCLKQIPAGAEGLANQVSLFISPGGYICGEESALMEAMRDKKPEPSIRPPYPHEMGLYGKPTMINNVETLSMAAQIAEHGPGWFARNWEKLVCVSGDVASPGVYPAGKGATLRDVIFDMAGGVVGSGFKFALVGGYSGQVVVEDQLDSMRLDNPASFGTGAVIVMNQSKGALWAARRIARFFREESCGKCVPCREGTVVLEAAISTKHQSPDSKWSKKQTENLLAVCQTMKDASLCGLGKTAPRAFEGLREKFPDEFGAV